MSNYLFLFHEFLAFVKKPVDYRLKWIPRIKELVVGFLVMDVILLLPTVIITGVLTESFDINPPNKIEDMMEEAPLLLAFGAIVLAPILEEPIFRFFIRLKYAFYFIFLLKLVGGILGVREYSLLKWMRTYWNRLFPFIYYGSSLLFGFVHIFNFEDAEAYIWAFPLLTFPQILLGLIFGFIRITYGFKFSILFHALHNALLVLPVTVYYLLK